MSGCRKSALSSTVYFESSARTSPSGVTISGLISTSMASVSTNARYAFSMIWETCFISSRGMPAPKHSERAWKGRKPVSGSRCSLAIFSGSSSASFSMSTPPSVVSMKNGFFAPRSNVIEK